MTIPRLVIAFKALLIVAAGTLVMFPLFYSSWYGDDDLYILNNRLLAEPHRLAKAWLAPGTFIEYYPIDQTVQWIQWKLWGTVSAFPYHVTNLVLHLTSALLLWRVLAKLGLKFAWLGGLIFAIHPAMVDSIAGANELKSTLSLPPFLIALCFYLDFEQNRRQRDYFLTLFFFVVAMLTKLTMAFFPGVMLLYAWWKRRRVREADVLAAVPFLAISLFLVAITLHSGAIYAHETGYQSPAKIHLGGPIERIALGGMCLAFYLGRALFPLHPLPLYPLWKMEPLTPWHFVPGLVVAVIFICCWLRRGSWGRPVLVGLGFFTLGLAPFLGLNETSYMALTWTQDHLLYIPIIGLIGIVLAALEILVARLPRGSLPWTGAAIGVALGLLAFQTWTYSRLFIDPVVLWTYDEHDNPDSWFPPYRLGGLAYEEGDMPQAVAYYQRSVRLNLDFGMSQHMYGISLCNVGRFTEGIQAFRRYVELHPDQYLGYFYLGMALMHEGQFDQAIAELNAALNLEPGSIDVRGALSEALARARRFDDALAQIELALQMAPNDPNLLREYGAIRQRQNAATHAPAPAQTPAR